MKDPLKAGMPGIDTQMSPLLSPPAQGTADLSPSKLSPPIQVHKGGDRQVTFSSERGGRFSYKLSTHKQDHTQFGAWQGCETAGMQAKSCSHLQQCWLPAQDRVVGSEATRGMGAATTAVTPGLPRAILWGLWHWGCQQGSEQEQGAGMDVLEEGQLGLVSPQCPPQSQEQAGVDRRTISQGKPRGSVCPKLWASAVG